MIPREELLTLAREGARQAYCPYSHFRVGAAVLAGGKTYVGVSAGSILATPTIEVAGWKGLDDPNVVELENLRALNLVNFHIFPHYHTSYDARIAANRDKLSGDLTCLANNQAVVVDGKAIRLV